MLNGFKRLKGLGGVVLKGKKGGAGGSGRRSGG